MNELSCQSLFDKTIKEYNQNNNKTNKITKTGKCSHKNLIISVCQELDSLPKAKELIEKLLDKPMKLKKLSGTF